MGKHMSRAKYCCWCWCRSNGRCLFVVLRMSVVVAMPPRATHVVSRVRACTRKLNCRRVHCWQLRFGRSSFVALCWLFDVSFKRTRILDTHFTRQLFSCTIAIDTDDYAGHHDCYEKISLHIDFIMFACGRIAVIASFSRHPKIALTKKYSNHKLVSILYYIHL